MVAAMEKRIEERKMELEDLNGQIFELSARRTALQELQEDDLKLLAVPTQKAPRKKKEAKDGKQRMEEV